MSLTPDTYLDEIVISDKETLSEIASINICDDVIVIEDGSDEPQIIFTDLEKITLGNICGFLKGYTIRGDIWTENYLGVQLNEWGYDWEIKYKE